jgi:hypothetical protein
MDYLRRYATRLANTCFVISSITNLLVALWTDALVGIDKVLASANATSFRPAIVDITTKFLTGLFIYNLLVATITITLVVQQHIFAYPIWPAGVRKTIIDVNTLALVRHL